VLLMVTNVQESLGLLNMKLNNASNRSLCRFSGTCIPTDWFTFTATDIRSFMPSTMASGILSPS
jgi:hypothetical protein